MRILADCRMFNGKMHGMARYVYMLVKEMAALKPDWEFGMLQCCPGMDDLKAEFPNVSSVMTKAAPFSLREHLELPSVIEKWNPAVFHATSIAVPCRIPGRSVITVPDLTMYHYASSFLHRPYFKLVLAPALRRAEKIVVYSEYCKKDVSDTLGIDAGKIELTPPGVDLDLAIPLDAAETKEIKTRLGIKEHFLLCVTNPKPHKNLPRFLDAWQAFKSEAAARNITGTTDHENINLAGLQLVVVSAPAEWLEKRLPELSDVLLLSNISDRELNCLYQQSEFLVFPSLSEGFGLPAAESIMAGRPVLASNAASLPEVAAKAGIFCDPLSADDMKEKMFEMFSKPDMFRELMAACPVESMRFDWKKTASAQLEIYLSAVGG